MAKGAGVVWAMVAAVGGAVFATIVKPMLDASEFGASPLPPRRAPVPPPLAHPRAAAAGMQEALLKEQNLSKEQIQPPGLPVWSDPFDPKGARR